MNRWLKLLNFFLVGLLLVLVAYGIQTAQASEDDDCRPGQHQCGHDDGDDERGDVVVDLGMDVDVGGQQQDQEQRQGQDQEQGQSQFSEQANQQAVTFNSARRAPTNFLYLQNQVEACGRTFGFSGSNTSGGWAFGIPIPRSWTPTCDLWKAAEEAQQNGFVFTSYMFQCSIKAVRKVLGADTCEKFEGMALVEMGFVDPPPDLTEIYERAAKYDERWLMADITQEQYKHQQEQVEYRIAQQQNLIDSLQQEVAADDDKIEALEQRIEDELNEANARRAAVRAKYEAKRQEKPDGPENPD